MQALQKKQMEEQRLREMLNGGDNKEPSIESRIDRCKHLQYEKHEHLFAVQYSTIHKAAADNSISGLKFFLNPRKKPRVHVDDFDRNGHCPIHLAAEKGGVEAVEYLVKEGCEVDLRTTHGNTALMSACKENQLEVIKKLHELNAALDLKNKSGYTAIHFAAQANNVEAIKLLLSLYSNYKVDDINTTDDKTIVTHVTKDTFKDDETAVNTVYTANTTSGFSDFVLNQISANSMTPLHVAALFNSFDVVKFLVSQRVKINYLDGSGETPLHKAGRKNYKDIYDFLIKEGGALENIKNSMGQTPKDVLNDLVFF